MMKLKNKVTREGNIMKMAGMVANVDTEPSKQVESSETYENFYKINLPSNMVMFYANRHCIKDKTQVSVDRLGRTSIKFIFEDGSSLKCEMPSKSLVDRLKKKIAEK